MQDVHPQRDDPVPELASLDGPFQLSEYLALKIKHDPHDIKGLIEVPRGEEKDGKESQDQNIVSQGDVRPRSEPSSYRDSAVDL